MNPKRGGAEGEAGFEGGGVAEGAGERGGEVPVARVEEGEGGAGTGSAVEGEAEGGGEAVGLEGTLLEGEFDVEGGLVVGEGVLLLDLLAMILVGILHTITDGVFSFTLGVSGDFTIFGMDG